MEKYSKKGILSFATLAILSCTKSLQLSQFRSLTDGTTYLNFGKKFHHLYFLFGPYELEKTIVCYQTLYASHAFSDVGPIHLIPSRRLMTGTKPHLSWILYQLILICKSQI